MKNKNKRGFTLVELIVVITIIAILGTIAFISLQGYSAAARDSRRISDVTSIKTSLELFQINSGEYPLPDDGKIVIYGSEVLWTQGEIGNTVTRNLSRNLNKKLLDPLLEIPYTYSVSNTKKEFEILALYEKNLTYNNIGVINEANASTILIPKIVGTYNELYLRTSTNIIPIPSIITSEPLPLNFQTNTGAIKSQIITSGENMLNIDNSTVETKTGMLDINFVLAPLITKDSLTADKITLIDAIQSAYTGSSLANRNIYKYILSRTNNSEKVDFVEKVILSNKGNVKMEITNGECGNSNGENLTQTPTNLCTVGITSAIIDNGTGSTYTWSCNSPDFGNAANCSANHVNVVNGICGIDNTQDLYSSPTNLCESGTGTSVTDHGTGSTYTWSCQGGTHGSNANCSANHVNIINGICGTDNSQGLYSTPINLCTSGTGSSIIDNGTGSTYTWSCNGGSHGTNENCSASHLSIINGTCGGDNLQNLYITPTNLCTTGTSGSVTDNGAGSTYTWSCNGTATYGTNANCSANHVTIINGVCGSSNGGSFTTTPTNLCTSGTGSSVTDGGIGNNYTWTCNGTPTYGTTGNCSASHITNGNDIYTKLLIHSDNYSSFNTNDDFTGNDNDIPNTDRWIIYPTWLPTNIKNNTLYMTLTGAGDRGALSNYYYIKGDFNIEVNYNILSHNATGTNNFFTMLRIYDDSGNEMTMRKDFIDGVLRYRRVSNLSGSYDDIRVTNSATSGIFKITRTGTSRRTFYDGTEIGTARNLGSIPVKIHLRTNSSTGGPSLTASYDNFKVNQGTVVYTKFYDSSSSPHVINTGLNVNHSTTTSKFGSTSISFDGTSYLNSAANNDWNFDGDFTIDTWVYLKSLNVGIIKSVSSEDWNSASTNDWHLRVDNNGYVDFDVKGNGSTIGNTVVPLNTWTHIAVVRNSGIIKTYVNGVSSTSNITYSGTLGNTKNVKIGLNETNLDLSLNGYLDELRISKGIARWTSNFTPPSVPYSN